MTTLPSDQITRGQPCVLTALIRSFGLNADPLLYFEQTLPLRNATLKVTDALLKRYPVLKDAEEPIQTYSRMGSVFTQDKAQLLRSLGL